MAQNSFVKSFLPGLVLGMIVGGLAGAFLPPIIESSSTFTGESVNTPVERRTPTQEQIDEARRLGERRAAESQAPETPATDPATEPATPPADPAGEPQATPPAAPESTPPTP